MIFILSLFTSIYGIRIWILCNFFSFLVINIAYLYTYCTDSSLNPVTDAPFTVSTTKSISLIGNCTQSGQISTCRCWGSCNVTNCCIRKSIIVYERWITAHQLRGRIKRIRDPSRHIDTWFWHPPHDKTRGILLEFSRFGFPTMPAYDSQSNQHSLWLAHRTRRIARPSIIGR